MKAAEIQLVVTTLLMTVTFAAGFTLPVGLDSVAGSNKGMAILLRKTAFRAFVISDVLAFACSAGAIFLYFCMADNNVDIQDEKFHTGGFTYLRKLYYVADILRFRTKPHLSGEQRPLVCCVVLFGFFRQVSKDVLYFCTLVGKGKPALSSVRILERDLENNCSLVQVEIQSGRPHQICIHLSFIGLPLIGLDTCSIGKHLQA